ncbi:MAG: ATP-binding protein [Chitinophagales bacterium]
MIAIKKMKTDYNKNILFENLLQGLLLVDKQNKITFVNKATYQLLGIENHYLLGKPIAFLLSQTSKWSQLTNKQKTILHQTFSYESQFFVSLGKLVWLKISIHPHYEQGILLGSAIHIQDISRERQLAIENKALIKELATTRKELDDFAYIISHDLKAPVRAIITLSEWITEDYSEIIGEDGQKQLELLKGRVQRMHAMIEGVLQYSRIGRLTNATSDVPLLLVIEKIIKELAIDEQTTITYPKQMPTLYADSTRIYELFLFLLKNAYEFNDKAHKEIKIDYEKTNKWFICTISDNGKGINERNIKSIFKIFHTLHNKEEHTGMGLTLSKKIVELYKGQIILESIENEGTAVTIKLPIDLLYV